MKCRLLAAASFIVLVTLAESRAAEVNAEGAKQLESTLEKGLPKVSAEAGALTVEPAGTHYEILYDVEKLLKRMDIKGLVLRGLKPFSTFATPRDDGMWDISSDMNLDVRGSFDAEGKKTDFTYLIGSMTSKALFDPAISYLRSGTFSGRDFKMSTKTGAESAVIAIDSMDQTLTTVDTPSQPGRSNIAAKAEAQGIAETFVAANTPPLEVRMGSMQVVVEADGLPLPKLRDLIVFLLDRSERKTLSEAEVAELKTLLQSSFPVLSRFKEDIVLKDLTASSAGLGSGTAGLFAYRLSADGPSNAVRLGFGMEAQHIGVDAPGIPQAYKVFMPDRAEFELVQPGLNFADFSEHMMALDPNASEARNKAVADEAALKLLPGDELVLELTKGRFVASAYDLEVTGRGEIALPGKGKSLMQATILARDIDGTIAAVQEIAKADPQANQLSFGLMMAKGFSKTDADGRARWDIAVAEDGAVTVNGQQVKPADPPAPESP